MLCQPCRLLWFSLDHETGQTAVLWRSQGVHHSCPDTETRACVPWPSRGHGITSGARPVPCRTGAAPRTRLISQGSPGLPLCRDWLLHEAGPPVRRPQSNLHTQPDTWEAQRQAQGVAGLHPRPEGLRSALELPPGRRGSCPALPHDNPMDPEVPGAL